MARSTSKHGLTLIEQREGIRLSGYLDSKNLLTIGVGHLVVPGEPYKLHGKITQAECDRLFAQDVKKYEDAVNSAVKVPLTQNQFDALVSFSLNIGVGAFKGSTVVRRLNAKDYAGAAAAMMNWVKPKEITGRRKTEQKQFLTPDPASFASLPDSPSPTDAGVTANELQPEIQQANSLEPNLAETPDITAAEPLADIPSPVEVEQVKPEAESPIDSTLSKWSARFVAVPTAVITFIAGAFSWIKDSPVNLTITLIISGSMIAGIYFLAKMIMNSRDKARADKLQADREQRAHEVQLALIAAAADKGANTVKLVSPPTVVIQNSDPDTTEAQ